MYLIAFKCVECGYPVAVDDLNPPEDAEVITCQCCDRSFRFADVPTIRHSSPAMRVIITQQIAFALQQAEGGTPVAEVCRRWHLGGDVLREIADYAIKSAVKGITRPSRAPSSGDLVIRGNARV